MAIFCYWVNFHCCEWPNILNKQSSHQGCRNSSVNSSVPSKLLPRVQVPSTPSKLLSIYIDLCHMEKTKINKKRPGWPIFKTIQPSGHTACEYQTNSNLIKSFFCVFQGNKVLAVSELVGQLAQDEETARTVDALLCCSSCKENIISPTHCCCRQVHRRRQFSFMYSFALKLQCKVKLCLWTNRLEYIFCYETTQYRAARRCSLHSSEPSNLWHRVRIPSTPSVLFFIG